MRAAGRSEAAGIRGPPAAERAAWSGTTAPASRTAAGPSAGVGADAGAGGHDAVAQDRARARRVTSSHRMAPSTARGPGDRSRRRAPRSGPPGRPPRPRRRAPIAQGAATAASGASAGRGAIARSRRGRSPGGASGERTARQQVELALPVLGGAADVEPVACPHPAEERHAVAQERRERLALDRDRAAGGDRGHHRAVEHVDPGVDGVRRDRLVRRGLLHEARHRARRARARRARTGRGRRTRVR